MPRKKGFLQLFTLAFFGLLLLGLISFFIFMAYQFYSLPDKLDGLPSNSLAKIDSSSKLDSLRKNDSLSRNDSISKQDSIALHEKLRHEFHDSIFSFRLTYDSVKQKDFPKEYSIRKIEVYHLPEEKLIQVFRIKDPYYFGDYQASYQFDLEDMDFDGYNDFGIISWTMINGNSQSKFWLYDPQSKKFKENNQLEETWQTKFDHKNKFVISWQNMTDSPFGEVNECFSWENGKMVLQHKEECQDDEMNGDLTIIMKKRINGKLVARSRDYKNNSLPITKYGGVIYNWDDMR